MEKRFGLKTATIAFAAALSMTGCGSQIADLSDEQTRQVGEYAAFTMLRYDAEHRSRLVEYSEVVAADEAAAARAERERERAEKEAAEAQTPPREGTYDSDGNQVEVVDVSGGRYFEGTMEDFLELSNGMLLTYKNYEISRSYEGDSDFGGSFSLDATDGKTLLILHYSLYNGSGADSEVNFLSDNIAFKCKVNNEVTNTALVTMLPEDMTTLQTTMRDNESRDLVLIYEIGESVGAKIDSIVLRLSKTGSEFEKKLL